MTHILHLVTWLNPGGLEYWLSGFIEATRDTSYRMSVVCKASTKGTLSASLIRNGTTVECCEMFPRLLAYPNRLATLIRKWNVDLVHNHMGAMSFPAIRAAQRAGVPVITTFHSPQFSPQSATAKAPVVRTLRRIFARFSVDYAMRHSQIVTGVSQGVLASLNPQYQSDPRFRITYLGIPKRETKQHDPYVIRVAHHWAPSDPLVLTLGRLSDEKNPLAALNVFQLVKKEQPNARLAFIGQGPLLERLKLNAGTMGLDGSVAFLGYRDDARALLHQADVLLQPSRYEGFGLAVIEAAVTGVPAVASDVPGLREAILQDETGYLHSADSQVDMAQSVVRILADTTLRNRLASNAIKFVKERFASERCTQKILDLYAETVKACKLG